MTIKFSTGFLRNNMDIVLLVLIFCAISCTTNNQVKENPVTTTPTNTLKEAPNNEINLNKPANTIEENNVPTNKPVNDLKLKREYQEPMDKEKGNMNKTDTLEETTGAAGKKSKPPGDKEG